MCIKKWFAPDVNVEAPKVEAPAAAAPSPSAVAASAPSSMETGMDTVSKGLSLKAKGKRGLRIPTNGGNTASSSGGNGLNL